MKRPDWHLVLLSWSIVAFVIIVNMALHTWRASPQSGALAALVIGVPSVAWAISETWDIYRR